MKKHTLIIYKLLVIVFTIFFISASIKWKATALAQTNKEDLRFSIETGFDGYTKLHTWTPIKITATNVGAGIEGKIKIKTYNPGETYLYPLNLPSQSQKEVTIFVPLHGSQYYFEFVDEADNLLYRIEQHPRSIPMFNFLVGVVSSDASLLNFLAGLDNANNNLDVDVAHLNLSDISEQTAGLTAIDVLIFNDIDTSLLTSSQQKAIKSWVDMGGHLIVGGGPNASLTAFGLADILPMEAVVQKTLPTLVDLPNLVNHPIPEQGPYLAAIPQSLTGQVDLYEQNEPLLISKSSGKGRISYFALDFGLAPMQSWAGNNDFWTLILTPLESNPPFYALSNTLSNINDALANIDVVGLPSPVALLAFLCTYIFVVIPLNYFVLKKLKRRELAWLTIPGLIILFSLIGYIGGFRARGGTTLVQQISIMWQNSGSTNATIDSFIGLYSPIRNRYNIQFEDNIWVQVTDSGSGFNAVSNSNSYPTTIVYNNKTELQNVWTDIGSLSTLLSHSQAEAGAVSLDLDYSFTNLSGTITNNSGYPLENVTLLTDNYGVQIDHLAEGSTKINKKLTTLDTYYYGNVTIWGDYYGSIDDANELINDKIIRSIFFPNTGSSSSSAPALPKQKVFLLGWQPEGNSPTSINITGGRVNKTTSTLLIVTGDLNN